MLSGEVVTRFLVWATLIAYWATLALFATGGRSPRFRRWARVAWTLGCGALWLHVAAAFQVHHGWSHNAAVVHTAQETAAVTGIDWGGGIWFNYLVLFLWTIDVAWWWIQPARYDHRDTRVTYALHGFLAFIVFNAVVVFETGVLRVLGIIAILWLIVAWFTSRHLRKKNVTVQCP